MGVSRTGASPTLSRLQNQTQALARRLASIPYWLFAIVTVLAMILKTGLNFTPIPEGGIEREVWPAPSGHIGGSSYGMRALVIYLDLEGFREVSLLGLVLTATFLVVIALTVSSLFDRNLSRLALLLILGSPAVVVALSYIGRFDIFVLTGSWLVAVSVWQRHSVTLATSGIILMLLGNPEHTAVGGLVLLSLTFNPVLRNYRGVAITTFLAGAVMVVVTSVWAASVGAASRLTYWPNYLESSWANFFKNLPIVFYSGFGILFVIVLMTLLATSSRQRLVAVVALFVIPAIAVATTLDQTRVFVGVSVLPLTSLTLAWMHQLQEAKFPQITSGRLVLFAALAVLILPAIEVDQSGSIRSPYTWFSYVHSVGIQFL